MTMYQVIIVKIAGQTFMTTTVGSVWFARLSKPLRFLLRMDIFPAGQKDKIVQLSDAYIFRKLNYHSIGMGLI